MIGTNQGWPLQTQTHQFHLYSDVPKHCETTIYPACMPVSSASVERSFLQ